MIETEDILQHAGVKGMKWGVIRSKKEKSSGPKPKKEPGAIGQRINSMKREHSWSGKLANADKMSTKEINKVANRAQAENDLKRLSKVRNVGSKKDKQDYLKREKMSDDELNRKVNRLRAKANLNRVASDATRGQIDFAKKALGVVAPLAVQYALTRSIKIDDVIKAATNPHSAKEKAMKSVLKKLNQSQD